MGTHIDTPAARSTDPLSSHAAADAVTESGARRRQKYAVAAALDAHGGAGITTRELAAAAGMDRYMVGRRMKECERAGLAQRGEHVRRGPGSRPEQVWRPAPVQRALDLGDTEARA